jgi:WD repeat-containing protein 68
MILDLAQSSPSSPYAQAPSTSQYAQLASASIAFPATKVVWEPGAGSGRGVNDDERVELLATTGDVLRIWELRDGSDGEDARGRGFVRGNGWGNQAGPEGYRLETRSVLTNVRLPYVVGRI